MSWLHEYRGLILMQFGIFCLVQNRKITDPKPVFDDSSNNIGRADDSTFKAQRTIISLRTASRTHIPSNLSSFLGLLFTQEFVPFRLSGKRSLYISYLYFVYLYLADILFFKLPNQITECRSHNV